MAMENLVLRRVMAFLLKLRLRRSSSIGGERFVRFSTTIYGGLPGAVSV
jgi:hypothetical protein